MNTYVLLQFEHKNDVTVIVRLAASSFVKFYDDCDNNIPNERSKMV